MSTLVQGRAFVAAVVGVGLLVVGHSIYDLLVHPVNPEWLILACLTLLTGSFTIKVPSIPARISVSETFVFTAVLLFGTSAGTAIVAIETLVGSLGARRRMRDPLRIVFNFSAAATSIWVASTVFYMVSGSSPLHDQTVRLPEIIAPLALLTLIYFLLNSFLVALALSFEKQRAAFEIWRTNFSWLSVNYFGGASVAALLVSYTKTVDLTALGIIIPLLIISYLTFKTSLGRLDDANRHIDQVNRMYLSTIETLATAIDAKDQVTHGHIRRVQKFALGLAERLDLRDTLQLKALEAAALLHDMGKLVVPEHILNKPGRLTAGEFEKMKSHASVGAQILSSIEFPYPVVPIVRHHHECWDGTGYPDGIKGTAIPLGARILSVVDCFDALTSDRPYRPKLEDEEALNILLQRRGSMYDPLVVDTFIACKDELVAAATEVGAGSGVPDVEPLRPSPEHFARAPRMARIAKVVENDTSLRDTIESVLREVRARTDSAIAILFLRSEELDEIVCVGAFSEAWTRLCELRIPMGARVSGWVAANGRPIVNADARLDLQDTAGLPVGDLRKCACSPLLSKDGVAGVMSIYTGDARGFSERDGAYLDSVCRGLESSEFLALVEEALQRQHGTAYNVRAIH
jgi:putative nucleotidyltransferase with HDIG domain